MATAGKIASSNPFRGQWRCPEPTPVSQEIVYRLQNLGNAIGDLQLICHGSEILSIGLEARVAYLATETDRHPANACDNEYWHNKCRAVFLRPAVEPIAISYWKMICDGQVDLHAAQRIVSALTLRKQEPRSREIFGRSQSGDVLFEERGIALQCFDRIKKVYNRCDMTYVMPLYVYASIIMAHPFPDGNGRLSRLLTLGALGKVFRWNCPLIGLAPSSYRRGESMANAFDALSKDGDWDFFAEEYCNMLQDAYLMTKSVIEFLPIVV